MKFTVRSDIKSKKEDFLLADNLTALNYEEAFKNLERGADPCRLVGEASRNVTTLDLLNSVINEGNKGEAIPLAKLLLPYFNIGSRQILKLINDLEKDGLQNHEEFFLEVTKEFYSLDPKDRINAKILPKAYFVNNRAVIDFILEKESVDLNKEIYEFGKLNLKTIETLKKDGLKLEKEDHKLWKHLYKCLDKKCRPLFAFDNPPTIENWEYLKEQDFGTYTLLAARNDLYKDFPMISDIYQHENKEIIFEFEEKFDNLKKFFTFKSLTDAVKETFNFSSDRLLKQLSEKLFLREPDSVFIKLSTLRVLQILTKLFTDKNHLLNTFEVLEESNEDAVELISQKGKDDVFIEMMKVFTEEKIKTILTSDKNKSSHHLYDAVKMFESHKEKMKAELLESRKEIKSVWDLHEAVLSASKYITVPVKALNQIKNFEQLKDLNKIKMPEGYGLRLAETNVDLIKWGNAMGHCVGYAGYDKKVMQGQVVIFAITKEDIPTYCVEVSGTGKILQAQGKSGTRPSQDLIKSLETGLIEIKLKKVVERRKRPLRENESDMTEDELRGRIRDLDLEYDDIEAHRHSLPPEHHYDHDIMNALREIQIRRDNLIRDLQIMTVDRGFMERNYQQEIDQWYDDADLEDGGGGDDF